MKIYVAINIFVVITISTMCISLIFFIYTILSGIISMILRTYTSANYVVNKKHIVKKKDNESYEDLDAV